MPHANRIAQAALRYRALPESMEEVTCPWCDEPILDSERVRVMGEEVLHFECAVRMVVGGVNAQRGHEVMPADDPDVSRREAARAALREWECHHGKASRESDIFRVSRSEVVRRIAEG